MFPFCCNFIYPTEYSVSHETLKCSQVTTVLFPWGQRCIQISTLLAATDHYNNKCPKLDVNQKFVKAHLMYVSLLSNIFLIELPVMLYFNCKFNYLICIYSNFRHYMIIELNEGEAEGLMSVCLPRLLLSLIMKPQQSRLVASECSTDPHCHLVETAALICWRHWNWTLVFHRQHKVCETLSGEGSVLSSFFYQVFMTMLNGSYSELAIVGSSVYMSVDLVREPPPGAKQQGFCKDERVRCQFTSACSQSSPPGNMWPKGVNG